MKNSSESAVDAKIDAKYKVLQLWCVDLPWQHDSNGDPIIDSSGRRLTEYFPRSLPQFAAWDGSQNSAYARINALAGIERISIGSLRRSFRDGITQQIQKAMDLLSISATRKSEKFYRQSEIAGLKSDNEYLTALNKQQTYDVAELHQRLRIADTKWRREKRAHEGTVAESRRRIAELEKKVASLTSTLGKVQGIGTYGRKD